MYETVTEYVAEVVPSVYGDVKVLGVGELTKSLSVSVHGSSKSAVEKIESAGPQLYRHAFGNQLPLAQQHAETTEFERRFGCFPARPIPGDRQIVARPRRNCFHELSLR